MELREIEYLLTIYETGSIRGAAERLMIAQPSLSQFLSQYESELGTKLFLRTSRGVVPTPAGEIFLADARKIRNIYHSSMEQMHDISKMKTQKVLRALPGHHGPDHGARQYPAREQHSGRVPGPRCRRLPAAQAEK